MKRPKDILSQPYHIQEYINYLERNVVLDSVIYDEINMEWLMKKHPQLTRYEAIKLKEFCFEHTIRLKDCYGDGQIMLPKWRESIRQN